jgi:signal transduction histidine kinase
VRLQRYAESGDGQSISNRKMMATGQLVQVLLIEDEDADAFLVEEALADQAVGFWAEFSRARSVDDLDPESLAGAVDCVLLDLGLPGCSGIEALRALVEVLPLVPVIILTGREAEETALAALAAGAMDYIAKQELTPRGLRRAVRYTLERHRTRGELLDLNARLGQFNRVVAHDLKSPLTAIVWSADLLRTQTGWSDDQRNLLDGIAEATHQAFGMIDDLLAYSHSEELELDPVALDEIVDQVTTSMASQLDLAGATVLVPGVLPPVQGHPTALRHIVGNLFANALAYRHPDRPPVITITAAPLGDDWRITVADNGIGIPPDRREAVFEPGVRLAPGYAPGTGLGLAAVRTLLERHGGRISVEDSAPAPGTRFLIDLPRPADRS